MTLDPVWPVSMPKLRDLWMLDPKVRYLNHGGFGATPRAVLAHQNELRERMEREPSQFFFHYVGPELERARHALASFVNAGADDLAFVTNATTGVNLVLKNLELEPGDEIVTTNHDYPACRMALEDLAARLDLRLVVADLPLPLRDSDAVIQRILDATSSQTRLVLIDHVSSPTGVVMPVEKLVGKLEARGIDVLVDGAHATGMLELDVNAIGAAYYVGNLHKWLCTPKGTAFVHVRPDRQKGFRPLVISRGFPDTAGFRRDHDWPGTYDCTGFLCISKAIETMGSMLPGGWPELRARNRAMACAARAYLCDALGLEPPAPESMLGALVTLPLPSHLPATKQQPPPRFDPLSARLFAEHAIEVPVFTWSSPQRWFRVSAQLYNETSDYEALAAVLRDSETST